MIYTETMICVCVQSIRNVDLLCPQDKQYMYVQQQQQQQQ